MNQASGFFASAVVEVSGSFTEITEISSGGFNILLRAKRDGRWWVLKALAPSVRQNSIHQSLLSKEYSILSRLSHPGVVEAEGMEEVGDYGECIVMEWIDGVTLEEWLAQPHKCSERRYVARQLFAVLEYVHSQQIVHRDLKPSNIMVTRSGSTVKLIDFGLSDADSYAVLKMPAGTDGYVSPEQKQESVTDVRNDIYSLGVILQEMNLGCAYRIAAKRCLGPLAKRYSNIAELRHCVKSYHRRMVASFFSVGLVLLGFLAGAVYNKGKTPDTIYDVVAQFRVGNLEYTSWGGGFVSVKTVNDIDSCIEIPDFVTYRGVKYQVDEVADSAFAFHHSLKRVVLPDNPHLHIMKNIFEGSPKVESLYFRSKIPPMIGNTIWSVKMDDVVADSLFNKIVLYVSKGSLEAYRHSPWGRFVHIKEYD